MRNRKIFSFVIFLGDILIWYGALVLTLILRYGDLNISSRLQIHKTPFTIIFILWAIIFYIAGLYDWRAQIFKRNTQEKLFQALALSGIIGLLLFYFVPSFGITPKTNLFLHLVLSALLLFTWRYVLAKILVRGNRIPLLFIGFSKETEELIEIFKKINLGYEPKVILTHEPPTNPLPLDHFVLDHQLTKIIKDYNIGFVVADTSIKANKEFVRMLYELLPIGVGFADMPTFYENITGKIPLSLISEVWFLENIAGTQKRVFLFIKRFFDIVLSALLGIITLILFPFIALAIKLESSGPVIFKQQRVGLQGKEFQLVKFRTMVKDAEADGARWAKQGDQRVTKTGKFLRKSRLDELPQVWNVLKGEMSFIGPRPERPEFIEKLKQEIPYYNMRHLAKPGLSGWAQINFPYGSSVKDAMEKLQYDLFYIKNRSLMLDTTTALKTLAVMLSRGGI